METGLLPSPLVGLARNRFHFPMDGTPSGNFHLFDEQHGPSFPCAPAGAKQRYFVANASWADEPIATNDTAWMRACGSPPRLAEELVRIRLDRRFAPRCLGGIDGGEMRGIRPESVGLPSGHDLRDIAHPIDDIIQAMEPAPQPALIGKMYGRFLMLPTWEGLRRHSR
jgi:hypothetical protein